MKKSTIGLIAIGVILVGGGGGCYVYQHLQTPPAPVAQPAPAPAPSPAPEPTPEPPAPGPVTTVMVDEKDNGQTLHVQQGNVVDLVLHSTYWQIQATDGAVLKPLSDEPVVKATLSNPPGMGTGTVEMQYQVVADGTATLTASRTTCGEALKCTDAQGSFKVTIVAGASGTVATPPPAPAPAPAPSPTPTPAPAPAPIVDASVNISGFAFQPATVTVKAGATVTWTNQDSMAHTVTADDGSFDSGPFGAGTSGGMAYSHTFTKPGTYAYHCTFHASMHGTVVVE